MAKEMPAAYHKLHLPQAKSESCFVDDKEYIAHLNDVIKATKAQTAYKAEQFRKNAAKTINTQKMWADYAVDLTSKLHSVQSQLRSLRQKNMTATMKVNGVEAEESTLLSPSIPFDFSNLINDENGKVLSQNLDDLLGQCNQHDIMGRVNEILGRDSKAHDDLPEYCKEAEELLKSENFNLTDTIQDALKQVQALAMEFNGFDSSTVENFDIAKLEGLAAIPLLGGEKFISIAQPKLTKLREISHLLGEFPNKFKEIYPSSPLDTINNTKEGKTTEGNGKNNTVKQLSANCVTPSKLNLSSTREAAKTAKVTESVRNSQNKGQKDHVGIVSISKDVQDDASRSKKNINLKDIQETLADLRKQKMKTGAHGLMASNTNSNRTNTNAIDTSKLLGNKIISKNDSNDYRKPEHSEDFLTPAMLEKITMNDEHVKNAKTKSLVTQHKAKKMTGKFNEPKRILNTEEPMDNGTVAKGGDGIHDAIKNVASIEQKRLLVKLLTPTKRHVVPPSPLRTELMKLTAALFKHGSIDENVRGDLKNRIIKCKGVRDLQEVHKDISTMFDDSTFKSPSADTL